MTHDSQSLPDAEIDPVGVIVPHLAASEDAIRCAAARSLGALGEEDAAPALLGTLMDPDPDVRSDAMNALERCARPQDAAAIRRSLRDDPVADVKIAAIRALRRLEDEASAGLLRALSIDRCEPHVAWEPPDEGWDDWLDVQVAAITALGEMRVEDAVDDLVRARRDETGQDLDHVVFAALANVPGRGVAVLLDALGAGDPRVRRRALAALSKRAHRLPARVHERLLRDPEPDVRVLAIESTGGPAEVLARLASNDRCAFVRRTALARIAPSRPDIVLSALDDPDESVRATALEAIAASPALLRELRGEAFPVGVSDLAGKARVWLRTAGSRLAAACASVLPRLAGADALDALREVAGNRGMAPQVRIAALRAMGETGTDATIDALRIAAADPARQVRLAALVAVGEMARSAPDDVRRRARDLLIDAARGGPRTAQGPASTRNVGGPRSLRSSKTGRSPAERTPAYPEDEAFPGGTPQPRVSSVTRTSAGTAERPYPRSTLGAIRASSTEAAQGAQASAPASDAARTSRRDGLVRPRRVAVDGCDDVATDIRLAAIRIAAECTGDGIEGMLAEAAGSVSPRERAAVLEAIARRAESISLSPGLVAALDRFLRHDDPRVRVAAARAIAGTAHDAHCTLAPLVADADACVRTVAIAAVAETHPEKVVGGIDDPSPGVRREVVDAMVAHGDLAVLEEGLRKVVDGGWSDTLIDACRRHCDASRVVLRMLNASQCPRRAVLMILDALGHVVERGSLHLRGR